MKKILFILGSLREKSFNKQVARYVETLLEGKAEVKWLNYTDVPFVNQDIEFPTPQPVARVRKDVLDSDALWVFTPEYNYSYPGIVKNLFDWLSRPMSADPANRTTAIQARLPAGKGLDTTGGTHGQRRGLGRQQGCARQ